jgi:transketolase
MFKCPYEGKHCMSDYLGSDGLCDADTLPVWQYQNKECKKAKENEKLINQGETMSKSKEEKSQEWMKEDKQSKVDDKFHEFAINYDVSSKESRKKGIEEIKSSLRQMIEGLPAFRHEIGVEWIKKSDVLKLFK